MISRAPLARRLGPLAAALLLAGLGSSRAAAAGAADRSYVIAVGYNGVPGGLAPDEEELRPLRFADDDAAQVYLLFTGAADQGALLATLDGETQRRHPELVDVARPPTLAELRQTVRRVAEEVADDRRAGVQTSVVFFYSGHGFTGAGGPGLALQDGSLGSDMLYKEVVEPLSAGQLHIIVDACHAEAVVRPRDLQAAVVDVTPLQAQAYVQRTTLARYPSAGAIVATTRGARAHEWDVYGSGVFTHELLSGLRGGADVDGNGRVEYSEIAAFLSAANRDVTDPRARLDSVIRTPVVRPRAPLIDLGRLPLAGRLRGRPAALGRFYVEDERGVRLLDMHAEQGFQVTLVVPSGRPIYVRNRDGETRLTLRPGEVFTLDATSFQRGGLAARGAIESELRRGLFGATFGPSYYLGYVDSAHVGSAVTIRTEPEVRAPARVPAAAEGSWRPGAAGITLATAAVLGLGALGMGAAAWSSYRDVQSTSYEQPAMSARDRFVSRRNIALGLGAAAGVAGIAGIVLWRLQPVSVTAQVAPGGAGIMLGGNLP